MFDKSEYIHRRLTLSESIQSGLVLFLGNEDSPINYLDNTYHFRQDSTFLYYFGISSPQLAAVIDIDENKTILFGNEMTIDEIVWMGRQETILEKGLRSGIENVYPKVKLEEYITKAIKQERLIHFLPPYRPENKIRLSELFVQPLTGIGGLVSKKLIKAVVAQRSVKSVAEIEELHKAALVSADMHLRAMRIARPGMSENEIAASIHQVALSSGGNIAYPIILTVNGHILHNHHHGNVLKEGDLVLNDSGAETSMGYAGDLTRTFPAGKIFSAQQKEMYNIVLQAYNSAVSMLKPDTRYLDVHYRACLELAEGLKDMGLMKGDMQEAVRQGAHALFFQCGTGHMMGLDVHDMEDLGEQYVGYTEDLLKNTDQFGLKSLRLGKSLEKGYVLTVEPGLYFIPELIDRWKAENKFSEYLNYSEVDKFRDFGGIRVEDDFVITGNGSRMLGKPLAITVEEIEQIRYQAY